ncbi:VIT domain-containing protein [Polyangium sp. y55x31]|uniref:VIT domain-containing protein n=1 Tax=Polyangium sp. y55x31 TaxID=3042688 RepID=UPI002482DC42|nr:VIT domain-containing protein [Polyangium sp. y55x31]MDI1476827.1 VIT domain-containing protein [Polyangium sp. y55x31]
MTDPTTDQITQGTMRTPGGAPLPLEHTDVEAKINGPVASVTLKQRFRNTTGGPIEAEYLFPLPHEASVHTMRFRIGERTVEAVVKEKEEAKRAYEAARREGRSATLLEQDRPNLFTLSVANIPDGETIEVTLGYQERLAFDEGEWRFVFPMVTTERYHAKTAADVADAGAIRPPRAATGERKADVSVSVEIRPGTPIEPPRSPSHRIDLEPLEGGAFRVKLHASETVANRDFVLAYHAQHDKGVRPRAYFERQADKMGTFLLVVTPPVAPIEDLSLAEAGPAGDHRTFRCNNCGGALRDPSVVKEWPGLGPAWKCEYCGAVVAATRELAKVGLPRDVVFLVDRSCSMRGQSLPQARRAVRLILDHLGPNDRAQVFAFDHDRIAADQQGEKFVPITKEWVEQIDVFLRGVTARGGTELEEALVRAAKLPSEKGRTRLVVLLTDGAVGNEGRIFRRASEILGKETRLYVLGVGPSVNRYLVERLARAGGGASDVLLPGEDVETVVPRFARRVRQAGPVLTNLRLSWDDAMPVDVYPNPAPELFGGQTVQLLGRFAGSGKSRLVLTAERATGEPFRQEVDVELPEQSDQIPGLERLWARLRIDARLARLAEAPGEAAEVRMEVLALALKHKLLSPYTALVAEDSEKRVEGPAKKVQMEAVASHADEFEEEAEDEPAAEGAGGFGEKMAKGGGASRERGGGGAMDMLSARSISFEDDAEDGAEEHSRSPRARTIRSSAPRGAPVPGRAAMAAPRAAAGPPPPSPAFGAPPSAEPAPPPPAPAPFAPESAEAAKRGGGFFSKVKEALGIGGRAKEEAPSAPATMDFMPMESAFADDEEDAPSMPHEPAELEARVSAPKPVAAPAPAGRAPQGRSQGAPPLQSSDSEAYSPEMLARVASAGVGELDLVFLVDETGSMGAYIEEVKRRLVEIIDALRSAPLCRSLRLGLVSYRDHPPQDRSFASRVVPLTDDIASIKKGVERMQASGGGDGPESVTDGLYDLVRLDWRPRAARVVVWVGDAPPHGVEPSGDAFPQGCPCGHHWYAQAENAREMGIVIHAVGCLPTLRQYVGAEDVFKTVARTARGLYLPLERANLLIPIITGVAETELDKQRIEEHIAEVLAKYEKVLVPADQEERVRFVTDVLRQGNVRPRSLAYDPSKPGPSPLRFRDITPADVEEGIERLRRVARTSL